MAFERLTNMTTWFRAENYIPGDKSTVLFVTNGGGFRQGVYLENPSDGPPRLFTSKVKGLIFSFQAPDVKSWTFVEHANAETVSEVKTQPSLIESGDWIQFERDEELVEVEGVDDVQHRGFLFYVDRGQGEVFVDPADPIYRLEIEHEIVEREN